MKFPQYRKYKNDKSYFKIIGNDHFIEWKKMTSEWEKIEIEATILPDRVFIADMLEENSQYWDVITESEYASFLKNV
tara:strand:- start:1271 stop:1501 length:231 start_codon:yes stop_codon:yes gene_type:complete